MSLARFHVCNQNADLLVDLVADVVNTTTGENKPPAKRTRRKSIRCTTPTWKVQRDKSRERLGKAAQSFSTISEPPMLDLKKAVIILPKIDLPDCSKLEFDYSLDDVPLAEMIEREPERILDLVEPKLELIDVGANPEIISPKVDSMPTVEMVVDEGSTTRPDEAAVCAVSLTRLDDDIFPPVRNLEIPLKKCVADQRNPSDNQTIPRKRAKMMANLKVVENGQRRLIPRFLTCKRCGLGGIARTSFSAHRNRCLQFHLD